MYNDPMFPKLSIWVAALLVPTVLTARAEPLAFSRRPYLQQLGACSVIVVWRTNRPSAGEVSFRRSDENPRRASDGKVGVEHIVRLENLEPNSTYSYRVLSRDQPGAVGGEQGITTEEVRFRTAPADGSVPVRFAVIGDAGAGSDKQLLVRDLLETLQIDLLLVTGDLVYPLGFDELYQMRFFDVYEDLFARVCVYPAIGNHDSIDRGVSFDAQFVLPGHARGGGGRHYSFDFGAAHLVAIDTNVSLEPGSEQREWLEDDLRRTEQPWKIVFSHHPIYTTGPHGDDPYKLPLRAALGPVFDAAGVDLVLAGHDHVYEDLFARVCVYPAFGNHDAIDGGDSFDAQFVLPGLARGGGVRHYSFDFGAAHLVAIDTNISLEPGSEQREWLEEDLRRTEQPWKIVFSHHPIYTTGPHGNDRYKLPLRAALGPVFDAAGVDLVLAGHDHVYERTFPIRDRTVRDAWHGDVYRSPRGTVYVVTGGGGARLYRRSVFDDIRYAAFQAEIHHTVHITVSASRLELEVFAVDGSRLDPIAIDKALQRPAFRVISGDSDSDGAIDIADAIRVLAHAFLGFPMTCPAQGDWDRDGDLDITDVVRSLVFQFLGGPPPPPALSRLRAGDGGSRRVLPADSLSVTSGGTSEKQRILAG